MTVRMVTLQIFATCPVVKTSFMQFHESRSDGPRRKAGQAPLVRGGGRRVYRPGERGSRESLQGTPSCQLPAGVHRFAVVLSAQRSESTAAYAFRKASATPFCVTFPRQTLA